MQNRCYIGLGSNRNRESNMEKAVVALSAWFDDIRFSTFQLTKPEGCPPGTASFLNGVGIGMTSHSYEETIEFFKYQERALGRTPEDKALNSIPIDIDILQWNEEILKEKDMAKDYVKNALRSLADHE